MKNSFHKLILTNDDEFIFNTLGIDFFLNPSNGLRHYYKFIKKNVKNLEGNLFEFGCFNGKTLLAQAILLKRLKSKKIIYGFDSFKGFPSYHKFDSFKYLKKNKVIYKKHLINKSIREFVLQTKVNERNISQSLEFKNQSKKNLLKKIKMLGLDNIKLIEGNFVKTVPNFFKTYNEKIMCVNLDSDLYTSYKVVLPYAFSNLVSGGYIHLDEYYSLKFPGAKIATDEFVKEKKIKVSKNKTFKWEFERYYLKK
tara:strand:- start:137 stop:895 length:759 start_codon:yes stop_codon:yes gene_type:complete